MNIDKGRNPELVNRNNRLTHGFSTRQNREHRLTHGFASRNTISSGESI